MIVDNFAQINAYRGALPRLDQYVAFAKQAPHLMPGRYELEGGDFAIIQEGMTQPQADGLFETHQVYADVQLMLTGQEWMEWQSPEQLDCVRPYEADADIAQYRGQGSLVHIPAGVFYYVLPQDAHKPGVYPETATPFRKIVFKIKLK